ncbi:MAG: helix-turn-helix domain containing protein [Rhodobacterales bacterium]|nr:MAG: helix-turn-helix domain containing protein [Rhodobacterales bacterium]
MAAQLAQSVNSVPSWVPQEAWRYLRHTLQGTSIRAVAREAGCHASTVLRQIRRFENMRDDPLIDQALNTLGQQHFALKHQKNHKDRNNMTAPIRHSELKTDDATLKTEGRRILRRLSENGAVLAIAPDMEKAVVVRELPGGKTTRTAVVDQHIAQAMALKDWISCRKNGRIARYSITSTGRSALKRLLAEAENARAGFAEAQAPFADQHRDFGAKMVNEHGVRRAVRYNAAESPLTILARRKDKTGKPFLSDDLVAAGERLREDFELAQMGPRVAQNWERFLTGGGRGGFANDSGVGDGPSGARERVSKALNDLGPGLGDVVLRCCCYLEGMEAAERRMGWSARSGKVVLRIALQRLKRHYDERYGPHGPMIG